MKKSSPGFYIKHIKKYSLFIVLTFLTISHFTFAQDFDYSNIDLVKIASATGTPGWLTFRSDFKTSPLEVFILHKSAFNLTADDEMRLVKTETDILGQTHYKFQQFYKDIKVEGAEFILHTKNKKVVKGNGKLIRDLNLNEVPRFNTDKTINLAKKYFPAEVYMWEDSNAEESLKSLRQDLSASYFPKPRLVIVKHTDLPFESQQYRLAYQVDIHSKIPYEANTVYIDAKNGQLIKEIPLHFRCSEGQGCTLYDGNNKSINTDFVSNVGYRLFDDCRGDGIHTQIYEDDFDGHEEITNATNNWNNVEHCPHVSAHWAAGRTYDYFLDVHDRNSYDAAGGLLNVLLEVGNNGGSYQDGSIFLSAGGSQVNNPAVSLDIIGHEFSHGVVETSADLMYEGESGALNESFCDIFGTAVEFHASENPGNYQLHDDFWIVDGYIRDMANPKAKNETKEVSGCPDGIYNYAQPDTYQGEYWLDPSNTSCDAGGVHINSGVQNHWFYLLSEGSADTDEINDNGDVFSLTGIGMDAATAIAYRALTVYLTSDSKFLDARTASINAAIDIYEDPCSFEVTETIAAWDAVGVTGINHCACEEDLILDDDPIFSNLYQASNTITSSGNIAPGSEVIFNAGQEVLLLPNFYAAPNFHAYIEGCTPNFNDPANQAAYNESQYEAKSAKALTTANTSIRNFPNPFSESTTFEIQLDKKSMIRLEIFDLSGRLVKTLVDNERMDKGIHHVNLNANQLQSGIYFYHFSTEQTTKTGKLILEK